LTVKLFAEHLSTNRDLFKKKIPGYRQGRGGWDVNNCCAQALVMPLFIFVFSTLLPSPFFNAQPQPPSPSSIKQTYLCIISQTIFLTRFSISNFKHVNI
jgi:hypothetical protein